MKMPLFGTVYLGAVVAALGLTVIGCAGNSADVTASGAELRGGNKAAADGGTATHGKKGQHGNKGEHGGGGNTTDGGTATHGKKGQHGGGGNTTDGGKGNDQDESADEGTAGSAD
jgi:hypothetical protein